MFIIKGDIVFREDEFVFRKDTFTYMNSHSVFCQHNMLCMCICQHNLPIQPMIYALLSWLCKDRKAAIQARARKARRRKVVVGGRSGVHSSWLHTGTATGLAVTPSSPAFNRFPLSRPPSGQPSNSSVVSSFSCSLSMSVLAILFFGAFYMLCGFQTCPSRTLRPCSV